MLKNRGIISSTYIKANIMYEFIDLDMVAQQLYNTILDSPFI